MVRRELSRQGSLLNIEPENQFEVDRRIDRFGKAGIDYKPTANILTRASGFMDSYDFTLNPYSGCSFGCTYCYAAFFSPDKQKRDSWGDWVVVKENAVELMRRRRRGGLDGKRIYMSSVTDPYQPIERKLELTRELLKIMAEHHRPKLMVQTRSPLVVRDCDLFRQIEESGGRVQVNMTVTTDDTDIMRTFEPLCPPNRKRLEAITKVREAGVESCITMTPLLLVSNDHEFADSLIETGVQKFIAQPFHFKKGKFVANTRQEAFDLMSEKLGCNRGNFIPRYLGTYDEFVRMFKMRLLEEGLPELGIGKSGFEPPW